MNIHKVNYKDYKEVFFMIQYNKSAYNVMFGNITEKAIETAAACIAQCTGCTCSCRCSCSGGIIAEFEWEVM